MFVSFFKELLGVSTSLLALRSSSKPSYEAIIHRKQHETTFSGCAKLPPGPQSRARNSKFGEGIHTTIAHKVTPSDFRYHLPFDFYFHFCCFSLYKLEIYAPGLTLVAETCGYRRSIEQTLANKVTPRDFRFIAFKPF